MSLTHDAVSAFKNRFLSAIHGHGDPPAEVGVGVEGSSSAARDASEQGLLAVAHDGSEMHHTHNAILSKVALLTTLQDDLLKTFDRAYLTLEQLAEARTQLARAEAIAKFQHEERESAARRLASMTESYHQTVGELEKLRPETNRLESESRQANEKLTRLEADNSALSEQLLEARAHIERVLSEVAQVRSEHDVVKADLVSTNAYLEQMHAEAAQLRGRCEIAEQSARASVRALDGARSERAAALSQLDEKRVSLASAQSRIAALQTQLSELEDKFSEARAVWSQESERFNDSISRLNSELAQAEGRDEAHQRLLSAAQADLGSLRNQCGDLGNQLAQAKLTAGQTLVRAQTAEASRDQLAGDLATSKRLHQSLLRRVKPLIDGLRKKNAENIKLERTLADFEKRFETFQSETTESIRVLQDREAALVAELEVERARRVVAQGALAIDREMRTIDTNSLKTDNGTGANAPPLGGHRVS